MEEQSMIEEEFNFVPIIELDSFYVAKHRGRYASWVHTDDEDLSNNLYMLGWLIDYGD